jgi:hypothetical protein
MMSRRLRLDHAPHAAAINPIAAHSGGHNRHSSP